MEEEHFQLLNLSPPKRTGGKKMEYVIETSKLQKYYGLLRAVDGIDLKVEAGELFGFLGINGAGKSTTINMLCTLLSPTGGQAKVCGYSIGRQDNEIRRKIGVVYQDNCLDDRLTVKENLMIRAALYERNSRKIRENLAHVCNVLDLKDILNRPFGKLSGGQKRRCEIARALMNQPRLLFLDEPTTGLDPATRKAVWDCIASLRRETPLTVFLTTHYMEEAARAGHIAVLDEGKMRETGTPFTLKEKYASDSLKLFPGDRGALKLMLDEQHLEYREKEECLSLRLHDSMEAYPVLEAARPLIRGFEVVRGTMDDVFLNITGKELKRA